MKTWPWTPETNGHSAKIGISGNQILKLSVSKTTRGNSAEMPSPPGTPGTCVTNLKIIVSLRAWTYLIYWPGILFGFQCKPLLLCIMIIMLHYSRYWTLMTHNAFVNISHVTILLLLSCVLWISISTIYHELGFIIY